MFKKILAFLAAMSVVAAFAAVDVNKATEAELDSIKGIGPVTSKLIIGERKKSEFKSWDDFITRVKGVGDKNAAKFSADGMTVGGAAYAGAAAGNAKVQAKADPSAKAVGNAVVEKAKDAAVVTKNAAVSAAVAVKESAKDAKTAVVTKTEKTEAKAAAKADAKAENKADAKIDAKATVKPEESKPTSGTPKK